MYVMDDLDQTEAYLATLGARKLAIAKNNNASGSYKDDSIETKPGCCNI